MSEAEIAALREYYRKLIELAKKDEKLTATHSIEEATSDFARQRPRPRADKNTEVQHLSLEDAMTMPMGNDPDLLALDEALKSLAEMDERKSRIVELRFFGGLSVDETAEVMKVARSS